MRSLVASLALVAVACSGASDPVSLDATSADDGADVAVGEVALDASDASSDAVDATSTDVVPETAPIDAVADVSDPDAAPTCSVSGAPGVCITVTACAAIADHSSTPGHCAGPAEIQCCTDTPSVSSNPPTPTGYKLMQQSEVTADMTTWAVSILHDPTTYPMFSTTTRIFGTLTVLARVEWHPPDFLNSAIHRGVTLYEPS